MSSSTVREEVQALAGNFASLWNGGREVLDLILAAGGDPAGSPWRAAQSLSDERLEELLSQPGARRGLTEATESLRAYLQGQTWFDRTKVSDSRLATLEGHPIAYFCMEYGLASWFPIYTGGLGILAGDVLKEASDMGLPMVAVGLFYRHGFPGQRMDQNDYQQEVVSTLEPSGLPMEVVVDRDGRQLLVSVPMAERTVYVLAWKVQVGRVPLYLLDTDIPENERPEDREITSMLYGGNEETRIRQEIVLGLGGVRALEAMGIEPSVYSMNEGHAALLGVEMLADLLQTSLPFDEAVRRVRSRVNYTNHTVVPAGNDVFPHDMVRHYLTAYANARGLGIDRLLELGRGASPDRLSMADLAFKLSGKANAVSELHARVIPQSWPGYRVEAVTNGVHVPTWLGPEIRSLLDTYVPDWREDDPQWERVHDIPSEELIAARDSQRRSMIEFINAAQDRVDLDPDALTIVWARRSAEYKRAWLIASDLGRLARLLGGSERPVQLVIAGKAHMKDEGGKRMMQQLLHRLGSDAAVAAHFAFVPDYNERVGRFLTAGADVWLNTPRKPLEASGTSGMKSSDNGGLQLTVEDGWAAEVDWWEVGWGISGTDDASDARQLYEYLEESVLPTFYGRNADGIAEQWAEMMKRTMIVTLSRYSARRMLVDYLNKLFLPLLDDQCGMTR